MELVTNQPVLVTGGTGFLGAHLIHQLLVRGYRVRATVRSASQASSVFSAYGRIPGVYDRLEIVEADLTKTEKWDDVLANVEYVLHCAALPHEPKFSAEQYTRVIIEGTKRLLDNCRRSKTIKKFVYFSCLSTLSDEFDNNKEYSESDWNETSSLTRNVYAYCKTAAEKLVMEYSLSVDHAFTAASIVPGMLWGPGFNKEYSYSYRYLSIFLSGVLKGLVSLNYNISDVRDVASAGIMAMEQERIQGRYLLTHRPISVTDILTTVHECYPDFKLPTRKIPDALVRLSIATDSKSFRSEFMRHSLGRMCMVRTSKAVGVGMVLRPPVQTIKDTVRYLMENEWLESSMVSSRLSTTSNANSSCVIS